MERGSVKKLIRSKSGLKIVTADENVTSPFLLREPQWTPDNEIKNCPQCKIKFDFLRRKHHCRRCGLIYCGSCCDTRIDLPRMCFVDPVRVCEKCAIITNKENDFFERHLKVLINGATFLLDSLETPSSKSLLCRLSSDHRHLILESGISQTTETVDLSQIKSVGILKEDNSDNHEEDAEGSSSMEIVYAGEELNHRKLKLVCAPEPHRKISHSWIFAMHQAFKLLYENQMEKH